MAPNGRGRSKSFANQPRFMSFMDIFAPNAQTGSNLSQLDHYSLFGILDMQLGLVNFILKASRPIGPFG
jgi:hypothetical protein